MKIPRAIPENRIASSRVVQRAEKRAENMRSRAVTQDTVLYIRRKKTQNLPVSTSNLSLKSETMLNIDYPIESVSK